MRSQESRNRTIRKQPVPGSKVERLVSGFPLRGIAEPSEIRAFQSPISQPQQLYRQLAGDVRQRLGVLVPGRQTGRNSIPTSLPVDVWDDSTSGEISGELRPFAGSNSGPPLESGCEMFLTVNEAGHTFKLSNSLTSGSASTTPPHAPSGDVIAQVEKLRQEQMQKRQQAHQAAQKTAQENSADQTTTQNPRPQPQPTRMTRPPGLSAVPPSVSLPSGTELMANRSDGQWLKATVVESLADGSVKVHWEDGSGAPDEVLHRAKLAIDRGVLVRLRSRRNR
jgi:hypothetical protein